MQGTTRRSRRHFLAFAGAIAASGVLAACSSAPAATPTTAPAAAPATPAAAQPTATTASQPAAAAKPATNGPVALRYITRSQPSSSVYSKQWDEFQGELAKRAPNLKVEVQPSPTANYVEQTVASIVAGTAADVLEQCCWQSTYYVQHSHALNLQPLIKQDSSEFKLEDFYKYQFDAWKDKKGDIYLVPTYTGTMVLYYNKDVFQQKGVPFLPKTWDQTIDLVKYAQIGNTFKETSPTKKYGASNYGMGAGGNAWLTQYHLRGYGANMVDPADPNHCVLDDPKALQCLEEIRKWIWVDKWWAYGQDSTGGLDVTTLFNSGKIAMLEIGSWNLQATADGAKFKWDLAPMPKGPAGQTTHQSVDGAMIWKGTKHPDESWTLLKAAASDWNMRNKMKWGSQPSRKSILVDYPAEMRKQNPIYNDVNLEVFADSFAHDIGRPEEMFTNDSVSKTEILTPAFDYVTLLNKGPVEIIGKAAGIVTRFNNGQIGVGDIGKELNAIGVV